MFSISYIYYTKKAQFCDDDRNKISKLEVESGTLVSLLTATWIINKTLTTQGTTDTAKKRKTIEILLQN